MKPKVDSARAQGLLQNLRRLLLSSPRLLLDSLNVILPTAIFFVKFLEWWYSPSSPARALSEEVRWSTRRCYLYVKLRTLVRTDGRGSPPPGVQDALPAS